MTVIALGFMLNYLHRSAGGFKRQVTRMMPIGVPRVPYRTPKEGGWQWVDIWNCLVCFFQLSSALCHCMHAWQTSTALNIYHTFVMQYRERIIFLGKAIDEETGNQLVATMLYLDSENKKDLNLYINCSGGDVSDAEVLHCIGSWVLHAWHTNQCSAADLRLLLHA